MSAQQGVAAWHRIMEGGNDPAELSELISEDAVFHSPVVHTPQKGRPIVVAYLAAAGKVLGGEGFGYVRELVDGNEACLEFETTLEGIHVNGVDLIRFGDDGRIQDFKVMVRPLKAVNKVWELMAAQLAKGGS
jgi:hypothetical protein